VELHRPTALELFFRTGALPNTPLFKNIPKIGRKKCCLNLLASTMEISGPKKEMKRKKKKTEKEGQRGRRVRLVGILQWLREPFFVGALPKAVRKRLPHGSSRFFRSLEPFVRPEPKIVAPTTLFDTPESRYQFPLAVRENYNKNAIAPTCRMQPAEGSSMASVWWS
jgi:hypothetical protein